jgi:hypothetical protein
MPSFSINSCMNLLIEYFSYKMISNEKCFNYKALDLVEHNNLFDIGGSIWGYIKKLNFKFQELKMYFDI